MGRTPHAALGQRRHSASLPANAAVNLRGRTGSTADKRVRRHPALLAWRFVSPKLPRVTALKTTGLQLLGIGAPRNAACRMAGFPYAGQCGCFSATDTA